MTRPATPASRILRGIWTIVQPANDQSRSKKDYCRYQATRSNGRLTLDAALGTAVRCCWRSSQAEHIRELLFYRAGG